MNTHNLKVYVGCSLTHASAEFKQDIEILKKKLGEICEMLCFFGSGTGASSYEIYNWDIHGCVHGCDLMVAVCDLPSTGLGWEMGTQVEKLKKPLLAVAHKDALVSDMILDPRAPGYSFHRYSDLHTEVFELVKNKLKELQAA